MTVSKEEEKQIAVPDQHLAKKESMSFLDKIRQKIPGLRIAIPVDVPPPHHSIDCSTPNPQLNKFPLASPIPLSPHRNNIRIFL